jgi:hypothetical protein
MEFTENPIFRSYLYLVQTFLSVSVLTSMTHPSLEGGGGMRDSEYKKCVDLEHILY